jgi:hypothetical protein
LRKFSYMKSGLLINCNHIYLSEGNDAYTIEMCADGEVDPDQIQLIWDKIIESIVL